MKLIEKLYKIAKERVFTLHLKKQKEGKKEEKISDGQTKVESTPQTIEKVYPDLNGRCLTQWTWFKEKATANLQELNQYQRDFELTVSYETQPKMETISSIILDAHKIKQEAQKGRSL